MNGYTVILALIILNVVHYLKGNLKPACGWQYEWWQVWLFTSLPLAYLGLNSWWWLVEKYGVYGATARTYPLQALFTIAFHWAFYGQPSMKQVMGLLFIFVGGFLIIKT